MVFKALRCALVQSPFSQGSQSCRDNMDLCMFAFLQSQKCNGFLPTKNTLSHLFSLRGFFLGASSFRKNLLMLPHQGLTVISTHISCENDILLIYYGKRVFRVMYLTFLAVAAIRETKAEKHAKEVAVSAMSQ